MAERWLHEGAGIWVALKRSGELTTSTRGEPCLRDELAARAEGMMHATSRLDRSVSGLVTFARHARANEALMACRARGDYRRLYLAIGEGGEGLPERGVWQDPIGDDGGGRRHCTADGKEARTRFMMLARGRNACLMALFPETGRTHQLRVHAQHHGVPLYGDAMYGGPSRWVADNGRVLTARRVMLHCAGLRFAGIDASHFHGPLRITNDAGITNDATMTTVDEDTAFVAPPGRDFMKLANGIGFDTPLAAEQLHELLRADHD